MAFSVPNLCSGSIILKFFVSHIIPAVMADEWAALAVSELLSALVVPPLCRT